ncbi:MULTISPECIES: DUF3426 domain-containing protein [unclassified Pseudomonas]|uniref:DUF3426 domain-containing protein n=1 Tax=unclassified Pseudomonas TaxID=196821 RepID=UPI000BD41859|nr:MULTISPECIES: DUF3426 domain-containing protein [unclassified Pseudomonas]PVZ09767.1 putative Zn finger-like uncharacterized protein [Pseudomonas sp. URIL14HWK12:I12]PVZ21477.1 putative Zn finger-like uncharacterized protein [Pseudomonas sp. URIL14HWK12:I10]PVZ30342.1 putative Zn finger-like uncharacterized protein [Pseudomonas sp. URIL14HWK12:I11]SNZ18639.1 MJ0042 family finger-like domain-containing protein [Pseudomonas sp. URIL14HWK12:I9]
MTDSFVTQCPHCQTRFRVSYNQLGAARGAVRCGACKQVFNAARQLLEQSAQAQPPAAAAAASPLPEPSSMHAGHAPAPAAQPRPASHAQPLNQLEWQAAHLDQLDLDSELAQLERRSPASRPAIAPGLSASREAGEEPWPEEPFGRHHDDEADEAMMPPELDPERQEPSLAAGPLDDLHLSAEPEAALEPELPASEVAQDPRLGNAHGLDDDHEPASAPGRPARTEPGLRNDHLLDLQDDPLQLQWQRSRSSWGKRLGWSLLSLLAAVGLVAQYLFYHFDEVARQDQYRPWVQGFCQVVGCTLPSRVDVSQIKSSNLVVRSHPDFAGALVVDAIIYNRAPFSQPFPLLELRFADLNGQSIASRRFKPAEYLAGDLAGQADMPPQTPIHIALDILDPGPKAVNYSLAFRSPE